MALGCKKNSNDRAVLRECRSFGSLHRYDDGAPFDHARRSLFNASSDATCFDPRSVPTPACNFPLRAWMKAQLAVFER